MGSARIGKGLERKIQGSLSRSRKTAEFYLARYSLHNSTGFLLPPQQLLLWMKWHRESCLQGLPGEEEDEEVGEPRFSLPPCGSRAVNSTQGCNSLSLQQLVSARGSDLGGEGVQSISH